MSTILSGQKSFCEISDLFRSVQYHQVLLRLAVYTISVDNVYYAFQIPDASFVCTLLILIHPNTERVWGEHRHSVIPVDVDTAASFPEISVFLLPYFSMICKCTLLLYLYCFCVVL